MIPTGPEEGGPRDHPHFAIDYGFLKANNPDIRQIREQPDPHRSGGEVWAHDGDGSSGEGQCCTVDCDACGGLVG